MTKLKTFLLVGTLFVVPVFAFADHTTDHTIQRILQEIAVLNEKLATLQQQSGTSSGGGGGGEGGGTIIPPPVFDEDRSNDDIFNINNLTIGNVQSGQTFPFIITASKSKRTSCTKFEDQDSEKGVEA